MGLDLRPGVRLVLHADYPFLDRKQKCLVEGHYSAEIIQPVATKIFLMTQLLDKNVEQAYCNRSKFITSRSYAETGSFNKNLLV